MIVRGSIEILDLLTLISFLSYSNKSGILMLNANHSEGAIFFSNGEIVDAFLENKRGEEALVHLILNYSAVNFCFYQSNISRNNTINKKPEGLILELIKIFDENNNKDLLLV